MMTSLLEGKMKRALGKTFSGVASVGSLRREIPGQGTDPWGDPLPGTIETYPFRGWRETYDAAWRGQAGIPGTDARLLVLADTITTQPRQGEMVQIDGGWWRIRAIEGIDPAGAAMMLQVYEVSAPT